MKSIYCFGLDHTISFYQFYKHNNIIHSNNNYIQISHGSLCMKHSFKLPYRKIQYTLVMGLQAGAIYSLSTFSSIVLFNDDQYVRLL